jgi:hypothetical protein
VIFSPRTDTFLIIWILLSIYYSWGEPTSTHYCSSIHQQRGYNTVLFYSPVLGQKDRPRQGKNTVTWTRWLDRKQGLDRERTLLHVIGPRLERQVFDREELSHVNSGPDMKDSTRQGRTVSHELTTRQEIGLDRGSVRYHCGGWSEELNSHILLLAYMVYL